MPTILSRRMFLRATGVSLALPLLDAMLPRAFAAAGGAEVPRRMVAVCSNMGMLPEYFFPQRQRETSTERGSSPLSSRYLDLLADFRGDFSVFSGVSHPDVDGGHHAEDCFLTAAPHPGAGGFRNTISLDQYAAQRVGIRTRVPSLGLHVGNENGKHGLGWTAGGVMVPAEDKPSAVFKRLFLQGSKSEVAAQVERLRVGRSILDTVADRAKSLERRLGPTDRDKLDEYFGSVRELEQRMETAAEWERLPKPTVAEPMPTDIDDNRELIGRTRLMYRMAKLALQTDSTRIITVQIDENSNPTPNIEGVNEGHHSLTHHGSRTAALDQLTRIEAAQFTELRDLLAALKGVGEGGETLLDRTMVLYGSNLGNANNHSNQNLPILLAGGGFRHGRHLAFDEKRNTPLPNLFVSMLQRLGVETDRFASSTGTLSGLEMV